MGLQKLAKALLEDVQDAERHDGEGSGPPYYVSRVAFLAVHRGVDNASYLPALGILEEGSEGFYGLLIRAELHDPEKRVSGAHESNCNVSHYDFHLSPRFYFVGLIGTFYLSISIAINQPLFVRARPVFTQPLVRSMWAEYLR